MRAAWIGISLFCLGVWALVGWRAWMLITILSGCGEAEFAEGWEPVTRIQTVPIYTEVTEDERCIISAVLNSYMERYERVRVQGIFIIRDYEQTIPCLEGPHGTACRWSEVNAALGWEDRGERGAGGLAREGYTLVSFYGAHAPFFSLNLMHGLGHISLGMKHDTPEEKSMWCLWENDMWFDWTLPHVRQCGVSPLEGTHWYLCPWSD